MGNSPDFFFVEQEGRVEKIFSFPYRIAVGCADQYADGIRVLADDVDGRIAFADEIIELEEIPGRIPANTQLAENNKIASLLFRFFNSADDLLRIAFEIADVIVLLCEENLHNPKATGLNFVFGKE